MHTQLSRELLRKVSERLAEQMGLCFRENRLSDLGKGLVAAAPDLNLEEASECATLVLSGELTREQIEVLARHLAVGETYFFRDKRSFDILRQRVLPQLMEGRRSRGKGLRIWCAGCASGEEVYSMAIALRQTIGDVSKWDLKILGTDINSAALQTAVSGEYGEWSFRSTPQWIRERYFERISHRKWRIRSEIRQMTEFAFLNLASDNYPSVETNTNAMDIVFCRNVLMYFSAEQTRSVAERLERAVAPDGWLFVSPSEASRSLFPNLSVQDIPEIILFRKTHRRERSGKSNKSSLPSMSTLHALERFSANDAPSQREHRSHSSDNGSADFADVGTRIVEAKVLWQRGRRRDAEQILLQLVRSEPNCEALELLARMSADDGRYDLALQWCERAIATDKLNASLRFLRASIMQQLDDTEAVVRAFNDVLYLEPRHVLTHYALAGHYRRIGRSREANRYIRNVKALLSEFPENEVLPGSDGLTAGWLLDVLRSTASFQYPAHRGGKQE